ncbi:unnamed protein product, partial [marine sediment metagenome]
QPYILYEGLLVAEYTYSIFAYRFLIYPLPFISCSVNLIQYADNIF